MLNTNCKRLIHDTLHMTVEEQLFMFLHIMWLCGILNVIVLFTFFLRYDEIVSRYFNHILFTIDELWYVYMRLPSTQTQQ